MLYPQQILSSKLLLVNKKVMSIVRAQIPTSNNLLVWICYENVVDI